MIPKFINKEQHAPLELNIPMNVDNIEIPQQESRLWINYHGGLDIQQRDSSQILSLVDFKGATIVGYTFLATKVEIPSIDTIASAKNASPSERQFPVTAWKFGSITFSFGNGRRIRVNSFDKKI